MQHTYIQSDVCVWALNVWTLFISSMKFSFSFKFNLMLEFAHFLLFVHKLNEKKTFLWNGLGLWCVYLKSEMAFNYVHCTSERSHVTYVHLTTQKKWQLWITTMWHCVLFFLQKMLDTVPLYKTHKRHAETKKTSLFIMPFLFLAEQKKEEIKKRMLYEHG